MLDRRRSSPDHLPGAARGCGPFRWAAQKPPWGAAPRCPAGPLSSVGGSVGTVAGWTLQRRFPADSGGEPGFLWKKAGRKNTRGKPLDPGFYSPLAAARSFWGSLSLIRQRGCFLRYAKTDLGRIFREKICWKAFCERKFPNQGTYMGPVIAHRPEQCGTTAKTSECQRAGPKKGGAGGHPPRLFASGLSLEKAWIPRPGPGGNPPRRC